MGASPAPAEAFRIRFAEPGDESRILAYIRDLAAYEDELDQVVATEEGLRRSLFEQNAAEVLLGELEGRPIGFALFHAGFSTFLGTATLHLVDLYIEPSHRGKGHGKALLSRLAAIAVERGCGRLEWWCHDWNAPAIRLYRQWGAFPLDNLRVYRLCGQALQDFAHRPSAP